MLHECLIQGLLQDCPHARPRTRFKIIVARLLHGCCKACYRACCKIVARVLQECLIQGLLQDCPPARPRHCFKMIAARLLQGCCKNAAMFASRLVVTEKVLWVPRRAPGVDLAFILVGLGSHFRCIWGLIFVFFMAKLAAKLLWECCQNA